MIFMLRLFSFFVLIIISTYSFSNEREYKFYHDKIYESFITNNIKIWEGTVGIMEASYRKEPREELLYDIVLAQYGLIGYHLGFDNTKQGRYYLDRAEPFLEKLLNTSKYQAEAMAFQAAFYGFEMSLNRFKGVTLGRKSYSAVDKALEINSKYSGAWIEKGNLSFFTPSIFGGSKAEAVVHYSKAVELFEEELPYNQRWLYLNTLISLAKSHEYTGNVPEAIKIMEKVLDFEPKFKWAKEDYLPNLEKKN
jgi:tetratricopeptide (TPR) repeat protein